jgi:hypothetical protein
MSACAGEATGLAVAVTVGIGATRWFSRNVQSALLQSLLQHAGDIETQAVGEYDTRLRLCLHGIHEAPIAGLVRTQPVPGTVLPTLSSHGAYSAWTTLAISALSA